MIGMTHARFSIENVVESAYADRYMEYLTNDVDISEEDAAPLVKEQLDKVCIAEYLQKEAVKKPMRPLIFSDERRDKIVMVSHMIALGKGLAEKDIRVNKLEEELSASLSQALGREMTVSVPKV